MKFILPFKQAHLDRVKEISAQLGPQEKLRLFSCSRFESVRAIRVFREKYLKPLEDAMMAPKDRENGLLTLYRRQIAVLHSVALIGGPVHFQTLASAARMIFELGVDIALCGKDPTDESAKRLVAFSQVERLRVSQKVAQFYETHTPPGTLDLAMHKEMAGDVVMQKRAADFVTQYWALPKGSTAEKYRPSHWSTHQDLRLRAQALDVKPDSKWEGRYVEVYPILSWHIHAGAVGIVGMPKESFEAVAATAYGVITDVMLDSYDTLGKELFWAKTMAEWRDRLEFLHQVAGSWYFELVLRQAKETAGFDFLEEEELKI